MFMTPFFKESHSFLDVMENRAVQTVYPGFPQESFPKDEVTSIHEINHSPDWFLW